MLDSISIALMCSVIAYVYAEILIRPGEVLNWWFVFLSSIFRTTTIEKINTEKKGMGFEHRTQPVEIEVVKEHWIFKPLVGCSKCVAGQMALWSYLFKTGPLHIGYHVFTVCLAILITYTIKKAFEQWN